MGGLDIWNFDWRQPDMGLSAGYLLADQQSPYLKVKQFGQQFAGK